MVFSWWTPLIVKELSVHQQNLPPKTESVVVSIKIENLNCPIRCDVQQTTTAPTAMFAVSQLSDLHVTVTMETLCVERAMRVKQQTVQPVCQPLAVVRSFPVTSAD